MASSRRRRDHKATSRSCAWRFLNSTIFVGEVTMLAVYAEEMIKSQVASMKRGELTV